MFCPACGAEERQRGQFCRTCGTDLRAVRTAVERPDAITSSAVSARNEIGRAVADKIRELRTAQDLSSVAEEVLPEIEKFLESPAEKRLRRIRFGIALGALGFGVSLAFLLIALAQGMASGPNFKDDDFKFYLLLIGLGFGVCLWGAGIAVNGWFFSVPRQSVPDRSAEYNAQFVADALPELNALQLEAPLYAVTEHTTHSLPQPMMSPRDTNRH